MPIQTAIMLEPFEFGFMQRAMIAATLVGGVTAAVGVFVILRRLAYIGHGLAHSIFGGAVVSTSPKCSTPSPRVRFA